MTVQEYRNRDYVNETELFNMSLETMMNIANEEPSKYASKVTKRAYQKWSKDRRAKLAKASKQVTLK